MNNFFQNKFDQKWLSEAKLKSAKRSFASKYFKFLFLTRSFASRFQLRFAQPFLAKSKLTINWSLNPHELIQSGTNFFQHNFDQKQLSEAKLKTRSEASRQNI